MGNKILWLDKKLKDSPAFRSLAKCSILTYMDFLGKRKMQQSKSKSRSDEWTISNNGEIVYPYKEAINRGMSEGQFRNSIDELILKGFLDINHHGSGGRAKDMTTYIIDTRWMDYGTPDFKPAKRPRKKNTKKGQGWARIMSDPKMKEKVMNKRQKTRRKKNQNSVLKVTAENPVSIVVSSTPKTNQDKVSSANINTPKADEQLDYSDEQREAV